MNNTIIKRMLELKPEVKLWVEHNFGSCDKEDSILGVIEELGELTHCILKRKQGIRETSANIESLMDAVGDTLIYLITYDNSTKGLLEHCEIEEGYQFENLVECILYAINNVNELNYSSEIINATALECIIEAICNICELEEIDSIICLDSAWLNVKARDWKKYPTNGKTL